jgi:drug/metabolite transporter (DMT)-like permease
LHRSFSNLGLALALLSCAAFATSGSFAASLIAAGWSPGAAVTGRVAIAAVVLTVPALLHLRLHPTTWASARTLLIYGVLAVAGAQLCFFNAVSHLSVAVALLVEYSGILLVVGWGWARHHSRPRRLTALGGATALIGLVLVLNLAGSQHLDLVGIPWSLGASVGLASYFVVTAEVESSMPPLVMAWGGLAVGAVVLGLAAAAGALPMHTSGADVKLLGRHVSWLVPMLGLSIVAAVLAYVTGIAGVRLLGAKVSSFVGLTEVLFAVLFAWLLLGQRLEAVQLVGGLLVVGGIALVRLDEVRGEARAEPLQTGILPMPDAAGVRRGSG